ncbi:hypothetical protein EV360DRAFT_76327 [Lentinula raphanica]|nr:hypothetical protein EV360DRAFT_76327 [Lentinula raphanica]
MYTFRLHSLEEGKRPEPKFRWGEEDIEVKGPGNGNRNWNWKRDKSSNGFVSQLALRTRQYHEALLRFHLDKQVLNYMCRYADVEYYQLAAAALFFLILDRAEARGRAEKRIEVEREVERGQRELEREHTSGLFSPVTSPISHLKSSEIPQASKAQPDVLIQTGTLQPTRSKQTFDDEGYAARSQRLRSDERVDRGRTVVWRWVEGVGGQMLRFSSVSSVKPLQLERV